MVAAGGFGGGCCGCDGALGVSFVHDIARVRVTAAIDDRRLGIAVMVIPPVSYNYNRPMKRSLLCTLLFLSFTASARADADSVARLVVMKPREGMNAAFETGYKRHLEWHKAAKDPWTWHGWTVVFGDRVGWFIDGTFDHEPAALDRAVNPAGDAADNATNVFPYANIESHMILRLRADLSRPLANLLRSPLLEMTTIEMTPGKTIEAVFKTPLIQSPAPLIESSLVYEVIAGGNVPTYIILRGRFSLAQAAVAKPIDLRSAAGLVSRYRVELLRYRADMSYAPE